MSDRVIGLVGCGKQGEKHLAALKSSGCRVICADVDTSLAARFAHKADIQFATIDDLFANRDVAGVVIATPTSSHFDLIAEALRCQKHVLCEKPLVRSLVEAEKLAVMERDSGRHVMVGFIYRFLPSLERLRKLYLDETLGPVVCATLRIGGRGEHRVWKHTGVEGGVLNEMAVHMIDVALWLYGPLSACTVLSAATLLPERSIEGHNVKIDTEDYLVVRAATAAGAPILLIADMVTPAFMQYVDAQYANASAFSSIDRKFPDTLFIKQARQGVSAGMQPPSSGDADLYGRQIQAFLQVISTGQRPDRNRLADSIPVMKMMEDVRNQSIRSRHA